MTSVREAPAETRTAPRLPRWAHPITGLAMFALPGVVLAFAIRPEVFEQNWGSAKYFQQGTATIALAALLACALGSLWITLVASRPSSSTDPPSDTPSLTRTFRVLAMVAFVAYGVWAAVGVLRGVRIGHLARVVSAEPFAAFELKQLLAPVAGVTTLTQVVPVAAGLAGLLASRGQFRSVRLSYLALLGLAVVRAFFFSERLAILECVLPFVLVLLLAPRAPAEGAGLRLLRPAFPLVFIAGTALTFFAFEFNRSWAYYRFFQSTTYGGFAVTRFGGYYTTALNNGALLLERIPGLRPPVRFSLQWLDSFPVVGPLLDINNGRITLDDLLRSAGNPEFNTESGLLALTIDWGVAPSMFLWFVVGVALTYPYLRARRGDVSVLPLYASLYVGIVESGRYFYWGTGRAFVPIVAGILVARHLRQPSGPQPVER